MADEETQSVGEALEQMPAQQGKGKGLIWLPVLGGIIVLASLAGFSVGRGLQGGEVSKPQATTEKVEESPQKTSAGDEFAYYEFESIAVSLNEPRMDRYLRIAIVLAFKEHDGDTARELLTRKKPELKSWLTVFLSGRRLDDVRGDKNLNRLQREIQDALNQKLWSDSRPLIDHVLFKDLAVQ